MPEDIFVNSQFDTEYDAVGDIKTVRGDDYIIQAIVIAITESVTLSAPTVQSTAIEQQRGEIEAAVSNCHVTKPPTSVSVAGIDGDDHSVTYSVETDRVSFPLTVS